jgi:acetyltransferase-like isoleucine patch superfamily enzyme
MTAAGQSTTLAVAGLGWWGPNLARNFDDLAELAWLCDLEPALLERFSKRHPQARLTTSFDDVVGDESVDAVVIATPVVTHYELARRALAAGKHVFVEKPMALYAAEAEELCALAEERELVLMPGHLLLYHPAVKKLKELTDSGELGEIRYVYGNRRNLGKFRTDENALGSLGAHDLSVILHLVGEEPSEVWARGESYVNPPVVAGSAQDSRDDGRGLEEDGRLRRHGARAQDHRLRQGRGAAAARHLRRVANALGRHLRPQDPERRTAAPRVRAFPPARARERRRARGRPRRRGGRASARAASALARTRPGVSYEVGDNVVVYPGTVIADGCRIGDGAVLGKQPVLSPRSTARREELPPLELGPGTVVSTGAVVFAGTKVGARVIVGDQACVRERCVVGDDVVIGRGALVENDTTIGALTKIQAHAYVTAYSTVEDNVFIAPCVITTNDNYMGRTEKRHALLRGPTIRRGARVGGGAVLLPGVEIGEEAFVGAGAVVLDDVPPRTVVVGNPARPLREVPDEELLENS